MSDKRYSIKDSCQPVVYQIRIKGHLSDRWTDWFECLTITLEEDGDTLITGPFVDQAMLHGVLKKVRDLGMPLLSVNRIEAGEADASNTNQEVEARTSERRITMNDLQKMEQEKSVLRWGGLAGVLGGIIFILVFVIVAVFVGDPGGVERFPEIRTARTVENSLYLVSLILWVPHFLALYRALRGTRLAAALFGSVLGILGIGVLVAGAFPHVATVPLSDFYHGSGATPADQTVLILIWEATWGIFNALLFTGLAIVAAGILALGVAMLGSPAFGKRYGWLSAILGVLGIVAAGVALVDPSSQLVVIGIFSLILFHIVLGWKVYRLSRAA